MRTIATAHYQSALTRVEVLVVILALEVLTTLTWAVMSKQRASTRANECELNLSRVGEAFAIWACEHDGKFPYRSPQALSHLNEQEAWRHFWDIKRPRLVLTCPEETEAICAFQGSDWDGPEFYAQQFLRPVSYFVGLTADEALPASLLSGDRNLIAQPSWFSGPVLKLTVNTPLEWGPQMHRKRGHVALADGSVQLTGQRQLRSVLTDSNHTPATNRLLLPTPPKQLQQ